MKFCELLGYHQVQLFLSKDQTADSTQISYFDLVFHRMYREDQLGMYLNFLVVFGGAPMCLLMHVVHVCVFGASMHTFVFGSACLCIWCIYAQKCVWQCMYVYMVHINASVIGGAYKCICNW